jgi:AraC family transcriptional activator of tynA and feaB
MRSSRARHRCARRTWFKDQRLEAAYQALNSANGMTSIAQIAYGVGFSDHAHFSNAFGSKFGHPPSEMLTRFTQPALR